MARSPNYPGVDLEVAVERAGRVWSRQQGHEAASKVVMEHLGYSSTSGPGSTMFGALKRYRLLDDSNRGRAALTELGIAIVRAEATGQRDYEKLRQAALEPPLYRRLWDKYGAALPDDAVIEFDLQAVGFTEGGAQEAVRKWKRTMAFAKLEDVADIVPADTAQNTSETEDEFSMPLDSGQKLPPVQLQSKETTLRVPLLSGQWASLSAPFPMTQESWNHFMKVLEALAPAYTAQGGSQ